MTGETKFFDEMDKPKLLLAGSYTLSQTDENSPYFKQYPLTIWTKQFRLTGKSTPILAQAFLEKNNSDNDAEWLIYFNSLTGIFWYVFFRDFKRKFAEFEGWTIPFEKSFEVQ